MQALQMSQPSHALNTETHDRQPLMHSDTPDSPPVDNRTTLQRALPYAAGTLGLAVLGVALAATSPHIAVVAIAATVAFIAAYSFIGVVLCGFHNSDNPEKFSAEVWTAMATTTATVFADLLGRIAVCLFLSAITGNK